MTVAFLLVKQKASVLDRKIDLAQYLKRDRFLKKRRWVSTSQGGKNRAMDKNLHPYLQPATHRRSRNLPKQNLCHQNMPLQNPQRLLR